MELHYCQVKKGLKRNKFPEPFLLHRYSLSPYQGCSHGCSYCDGRAEKYYVEGVFDKDIIVRSNLPELLEQERSLLREPSFISIGSGTTDAYLDAEDECRITRKLLHQLDDIAYPLLIATKNPRLLEDLELLKSINRKSRVVVAVSLTSTDDKLLAHFEPGAGSASRRLDMLQILKAEGIGAGVLAMPFLPGLTDNRESMESLYSRLKEIGVDFVIPGELTLRPGRQKEHFLKQLALWDRSLCSGVETLFRSNRPGGTSDWHYRQSIHREYQQLWKSFDIPPQIPHHLYKGAVNLCDEVFLLLCHMKDLYGYRGVDTRSLSGALHRYSDWLNLLRGDFARHRSLPGDYPDLLLKEQLKADAGQWLGNSKLEEFLKMVIFEGKVFDYNKLKLQ